MSTQKLAAAVLARRHELGLTQEDLPRMGGPSTATVRIIERGDSVKPFRWATLDALAAALQWERQSVIEVVNGDRDKPKPLTSTRGDAASIDDVSAFFGAKVRALRQERGWSQEHVTEQLATVGIDIHQTTASKIERGERSVRANEVVAYAQLFDVPVALLLPNPAERRRDDTFRAADLARCICPGPVGEAIGDLLEYAAATNTAIRDIHVLKLAAAVIRQTDEASSSGGAA